MGGWPREVNSRRKQHQLLGFPCHRFGRLNLEIHNQRFHDGIPVFLVAADAIEMRSGENIEPSPKRNDVLVLSVIVLAPCGQDELSFKTR